VDLWTALGVDPAVVAAARAEGRLNKAAGAGPGLAQKRLTAEVWKALMDPAPTGATATVPVDLVKGLVQQTRELASAAVVDEYRPLLDRQMGVLEDLAGRMAVVEKMAAPGGQPRAHGAGRVRSVRELHLEEMAELRKSIDATPNTVDRQPLMAKMREMELVLRGMDLGGR
jgi:hypothetical protein